MDATTSSRSALQQGRAVRLQEGANSRFPLQRQPELLDVVLAHPGQPIREPHALHTVWVVRRHTRNRCGGEHAVGEQGGAGQCVRASTGAPLGDADVGPDRVQDQRDLSGAVRDARRPGLRSELPYPPRS